MLKTGDHYYIVSIRLAIMPAEASWENMIRRPSLSASNTRKGGSI